MSEDKVREHRGCRLVMEEDKKVDMDWRQRLRHMWVKEGNANTRFFHLTKNDRRRSNQISRVLVGNQGIGCW